MLSSKCYDPILLFYSLFSKTKIITANKLNILVSAFNISWDEKKRQKMEEIVFINVMVNFVREPTQLRG